MMTVFASHARVCVAGAVFLAPLQKQLTTPQDNQSVALLQ